MGGDWDEDEPTVDSDLGPLFRAQQGRAAELEQVEGPGAPRRHRLDRVYLVFGRSADAEVRLDSAEVSRRHMALERRGEEYRCEDLESRNGIYLNGVKIHSAVLREGDALQLGNVVFIYHEGR